MVTCTLVKKAANWQFFLTINENHKKNYYNNTMENIIDYAKKNFKTFDEEPINEVDSLILSWISYLRLPETLKSITNFRGLPLKDLYKAEYFETIFHHVYANEQAQQLFTVLCASPRYRNIRIKAYTQQLNESQQKQFSAMTLQINSNTHFISFRGTDATIIGWKEDFNMIFECPLPSQKEAARYVKKVIKKTRGPLYLGGHSKGGNLAVYAAAMNHSDRVQKIYTLDGPGFFPEVLETPQFTSITDKIQRTIPQSSIFGMVLDTNKNAQIIQSNRISFGQHDPFSWQVEDHHFVQKKQMTLDSKYINQTMQNWILLCPSFVPAAGLKPVQKGFTK